MTPSESCSPTPKPAISPSLSRVAWMAEPGTMARHLQPALYQTPPHLRLLSRKVAEAVRTGGRLLVTMPPRHGKSETCSVWTPVWLLNANPRARVLLASYEHDFAATWGRRARNVIDEHEDRLLVRLSEDSAAAYRWNTPEGGGMTTAGVGGAITGRGADLLLIDDPVKNAAEAESQVEREKAWAWWQAVALTRLEPHAAAIVVMTRWHEDDLAGRLLREEGGRWDVVRLPALAEEDDPLGRAVGEALWPERYPAPVLDEIRRSVGSRVWTSLYQQRPVPADGGFFRAPWLQHRYADLGQGLLELEGGQRVEVANLRRFGVVDLAASVRTRADYSVVLICGVTADRRLLVLDVDRARREGPDLVPAMARAVRTHGLASLWVEKTGLQLAIVQEARRWGLPVRELVADRDKTARALLASSAMEGGRVLLPRHAPWLAEFEEEVLSFPLGRHDDQVDCLGYAARVYQGWGGVCSLLDYAPDAVRPARPRERTIFDAMRAERPNPPWDRAIGW